ncbi:DUF4190 domain-containing protein [Glutamicibacter sp. NPDC087673]|uniref:DUF4190 domain-containing protein n=1 Tax=Glutamicibacter sp. NPDC087673 TaxID=3363997 RepID=UPI00382F4AEA
MMEEPHGNAKSLVIHGYGITEQVLRCLWFFGNSGLAILAVGAGHVALSQITLRGGRGRRLAIVALVVGYAIAALALFTMLTAIPAMIQQYNA